MSPIKVIEKGFTLIELLVTLVIIAIVSTIAVPNFQSLIQDNRLSSQYNHLLTSLSLARSEAIKQGRTTTICSSNNAIACNGNWENGWIVFVDNNNNQQIDNGESLLRRHGSLPGQTSIRYSRNTPRINYRSDGLSIGFNGTFRLCDARGINSALGLIISNTGRARRAAQVAQCP